MVRKKPGVVFIELSFVKIVNMRKAVPNCVVFVERVAQTF